MAKSMTTMFALSVLPLTLAACGQSVTDIDSRDLSGELVKPGDDTDEDAGATSGPISEPTATVVEQVTSSTVGTAESGVNTTLVGTTEPNDTSEFVDPRPAKPGRGVVPDGDTEFSAEGCCSRVTGEPLSQFCPPGQGKTAFGNLADATDKLQAPPTPAGLGVPFEISLARSVSEPIEFAVEETTIDPPSGILDLSPVYWVWTAEEGDIPLFVRVPIAGAGYSPEPDAVHIFFSSDGAEFTKLADDYENAGFLQGTLPGQGFVVAGADPAGIQCF